MKLGKRMAIMLILVGILLGGVVAFNSFKMMMMKKWMAGMGAPPATVSSAVTNYADWQPQVTAVGSLRAAHGVDVTSEIAGLVRNVNFHSGDNVKAGDVLVQLTTDTEQAQLHALQAAADLAQTTLKRDQAQLQAQAVPQAQVDGDNADLRVKQAQVAAQQALIDKKTIRAPFAGKLGISSVNPGQYLNPGEVIVTLQAINPILVDFNVPQDDVGKLSIGQSLSVVAANNGKPVAGRLTAITPKLDPATRNAQIEATLDNADGRLLPGMYAHVAVDTGAKQHLLTLPQTAITYNPYGATVYRVLPGATPGKDGKTLPVAQQAFVTTGSTRGDQVAILSGLKQGDEVVTSGQLKLKNGTSLIINNSVQPANDADPKPHEQ